MSNIEMTNFKELLSVASLIALTSCADPTNTRQESPESERDSSPSDIGSDGSSDPDVDTDNEVLDLGEGLLFEGLDHAEISYMEDVDGVCETPNWFYFAYASQHANHYLYLHVVSNETLSGEYLLNETVSGQDGWGEKESTNFSNTVYIVEDSKTYTASSGSVEVVVDEKAGVATVSLKDLSFPEYGASGALYSGSVTLDILVYCLELVDVPEKSESGGSCGYVNDSIPYDNEFCLSATSSYSTDVLR